MTISKTFKAAALASVCMAPLASMAIAADDTGFDLPEAMPNTQELKRISAQPEETTKNEVSVGLQGQTSTSAVFGRYNGNFREGGSLTGSFSLRDRADWKSGDTFYYDANGRDLKLGFGGSFDKGPNSSANLRMGNQGVWGLTAGYDAMTYVQSNSFMSAYDKNGTLVNGLGAGATTATAATRLNSNVVGTRRDKGLVGLNFSLGDWALTSGLVHEHKDGTMVQSFDLTTNVTFPMPINYDTDRFDVAAAYNTKRFQSRLSYTFSKFTDNNSYIGFTPLVNASRGAAYSLPPDNLAHQFAGQFAYNLTDTTRLNANLSYGLQMQDEGFVPATLNTTYASSNFSNNKTSLDGMVQTMFANVALTSRPLPRTDFRLSYTVDSRQNGTPGQYNVVGTNNDTDASLRSHNAVANSWTKQTAQVEAGYRLLDSTKLTLGYAYRETNRNEAIINRNTENEGTAKIRTTFNQYLTSSLGYNHSVRTASSPNFARAWQNLASASDCNDGAATGRFCFGVPYYQKGRIQDGVSNRITATLNEDTSISLNSKFSNNSYLGQEYGLIHDYTVSSGPDLSYHINATTDFNAFYTFQRSFRTTKSNTSTTINPATGIEWNESTAVDTQTLGLGGSWKPADDWKLSANYVMSYSDSGFELNSAGNMTTGGGQLPHNTSLLNTLSLRGEYELVPGVTLFGGYQFDRLITNDWAMWGAPYGGGTNGLLTGDSNPSYAVHTVMTKVSFKW